MAGIRVVALGGGTGLANLLTGLKQYVHTCAGGLDPSVGGIANLCAVVTVTDDGGSSGRLRKEFNILPPGDIRNCIAALSEDEAPLSTSSSTGFMPALGSADIVLETYFSPP